MGYLLFVLWLFVRLGHRGVVFCCVWPFPSLSGFKKGSSSDTTNYPVSWSLWSPQIAWIPERVGTKKASGTRYYCTTKWKTCKSKLRVLVCEHPWLCVWAGNFLSKTPKIILKKKWVEPCQVDQSRYWWKERIEDLPYPLANVRKKFLSVATKDPVHLL